jgi:hypothetical protein
MDNQAWYAVLRHRRGNPDTRFTVTYPYCCTLSTLPADGTLALERPPRVEPNLAMARHLVQETALGLDGEKVFSPEKVVTRKTRRRLPLSCNHGPEEAWSYLQQGNCGCRIIGGA